jgi:hypothetical protein
MRAAVKLVGACLVAGAYQQNATPKEDVNEG